MKEINKSSQQCNVIHRLRCMIPDSSEITDAELDEFESKVEIDEFLNFEYAGSFILTENAAIRNEALDSMCCGIISKDVKLSNGKTLYFAFDYGH